MKCIAFVLHFEDALLANSFKVAEQLNRGIYWECQSSPPTIVYCIIYTPANKQIISYSKQIIYLKSSIIC